VVEAAARFRAMIDRRVFVMTMMAAVATRNMARATQANTRGFYAPGEESPHARTWMCWPSTPAIYDASTDYFESIQETIGRLAATIAENEPVTMLADAALHPLASELCGTKVDLRSIATDDMWARDCGPVFVRNQAGKKAVVDFNFNGWGNRQQHASDELVSAAVADDLGYDCIKAGAVGEGGGIEYDGEGTLILTESCWVNDNRNPGKTRGEIEAELKATLGVETVIWLPGVRNKDITDGHIDGSVRIVRPGVLMTGGYPGDSSEWGLAHAESKEILRKSVDARGRSFEIVEIPSAVEHRSNREDFFTGYANYYVGNGAVYTPEFGDRAADARAVANFRRLFPERRVVSLEVDRIYENGGGIHCVTQQEPDGVRKTS
jgi:agmatine deiminase